MIIFKKKSRFIIDKFKKINKYFNALIKINKYEIKIQCKLNFKLLTLEEPKQVVIKK